MYFANGSVLGLSEGRKYLGGGQKGFNTPVQETLRAN